MENKIGEPLLKLVEKIVKLLNGSLDPLKKELENKKNKKVTYNYHVPRTDGMIANAPRVKVEVQGGKAIIRGRQYEKVNSASNTDNNCNDCS